MNKLEIYDDIDEELRSIFENDVDHDTGEITDEVAKRIGDLETEREKIEGDLGTIYREKKAEGAVYQAEEDRLYAMRKACEKTCEGIRGFLTEKLKEGFRTVKTKAVSVSWRKARGSLMVSNEEEITEAPLDKIPDAWRPYLSIKVSVSKTRLKADYEAGNLPFEVFQRVHKIDGKKGLVIK